MIHFSPDVCVAGARMNLTAPPPPEVGGAATVICLESCAPATDVPAFNALGEENRGTGTRVRRVFSALPKPFLITNILSHTYHFVSNPQRRVSKNGFVTGEESLLRAIQTLGLRSE